MAPITALFRSVNTPKALNPRPAQSKGSVMSSGSNWVSKSIPVSATSAAMNSIAPAGGGIAEMPGREGEQQAGDRLRPADSGSKSAPRSPCIVRAATAS
jgi:hypothetical protein